MLYAIGCVTFFGDYYFIARDARRRYVKPRVMVLFFQFFVDGGWWLVGWLIGWFVGLVRFDSLVGLYMDFDG
jgi:hypothetical protein